MSNAPLTKFIVFYSIPAAVMADWSKTDEKVRKDAESKMKAEWQKWMGEHAGMIKTSDACGKTKKITASGVTDTRNDICLYSIIEAESHEAAAKVFEKHPHLQIPQAYIEVMALRSM